MISIVIPVYEEEQALPILFPRLRGVLDALAEDYEVIIVDDGSADRTIPVVLAASHEWPQLRLLTLGRNRGHQVALMAGLQRARGELIVTMDGDGQHPPEALPAAIERLALGDLDVLNLRRDDSNSPPLLKRLPSKMFYRILEALMEGGASAPVGDFRVLSAQASQALQGLAGPVVLRAALPLLGLRSGELTYREGERSAGVSKYTVRRMVRLAVDSVLNVSTRPLRLASIAAFSVTVVAGLWTVAVVVSFFQGRTVAGWASVMVAVLILGAIELAILAVQGQYLARMYDVVLGRHDPIIRELHPVRDPAVDGIVVKEPTDEAGGSE